MHPTRISSRIRRMVAALGAALIIVGGLAACAPEERVEPGHPTAIQASVQGDAQPTVEVAPLDPPSRQGISELGSMTGFIVGTPMSIEMNGEIPESGVVLTRTYASPLPVEASVTFAFWNAEYETWQAVPSTLSDDRMTLTAVVHHLSWWTDFIAGGKEVIDQIVDGAEKAGQAVSEWVNDAVTTAGEALHWSIGNIFGTRVELPTCDFPTPTWVQELPVGTNVDDPVRFCAGYDTARPDLLVVKARANRGYGFPVQLAAKPAWEYNSSSDNTLGSAIDIVGNIDKAVGNSMSELLNKGRFVAAGQEISFGIPASAMRKYSSEYLIELPAPSVGQFVFSTIAQQLVAWGVDNTAGTLGAAIAVASCWSSFAGSDDVGKVTGAALSCISNADTAIAQLLGKVLLQRGVQENLAGKVAGKIIGRISLALALLPAVINTFDYIAERNFPRNVRALTISLNQTAFKPKPITEASVANYLIPAGACVGWSDSKPIQLVNGQGENFDANQSGTGILETTLVGKADLNGDGSDDAVLNVRCTGTPAKFCCAGRGSIITTIIALDVSGGDPELIGSPIVGGDLESSEGDVPATIYTTEGHLPRLEGTSILTFEGPLYDMDDPTEPERISGWYRHDLVDSEWSRSAK